MRIIPSGGDRERQNLMAKSQDIFTPTKKLLTVAFGS